MYREQRPYICISLALCHIALALLALAVATSYWLRASDSITSYPVQTADHYPYDDRRTSVRMHCGLWMICTTMEGERLEQCSYIGHDDNLWSRVHQDHRYGHWWTQYKTVKVNSVFLLSIFLEIAAIISTLCAYFKGHPFGLTAAVIHVFAALSIGTGLMFYADTVAVLMIYQTDTFVCAYGWSFYITCVAMVCSLVAAAINVSVSFDPISRNMR